MQQNEIKINKLNNIINKNKEMNDENLSFSSKIQEEQKKIVDYKE